jgi:hypothetical protein
MARTLSREVDTKIARLGSRNTAAEARSSCVGVAGLQDFVNVQSLGKRNQGWYTATFDNFCS